MRQGHGAALMGALLLATIPTGSALAAFGGPSDEALITSRDLWSQNQRVSANAPDYTARVKRIQGETMLAQAPIDTAIDALRRHIVEQLAGSNAIDATELQAFAQQIFALRKQLDVLDSAREVAIRAALTPAELALVTQRHQQFVAINTEQAALDNPEHYPESAYRLGDLFGDNLGSSRGIALSSDQLQRQQAIKDGYTAIFKSIQAQRKAVHHQLFDTLTGAANVTAADLAPLQQQASALKDQLDTQRLAMAFALRAVLTPEQLARSADQRSQLAALRTQYNDAANAVQVKNATAAP